MSYQGKGFLVRNKKDRLEKVGLLDRIELT